jgi:hypothetical protein
MSGRSVFALTPAPLYSPTMKRHHPLLAAVLGLMLCVQGLAIAAAPVDVQPDETEAAMEMPCHGESADVAACDCCDGDCPDMASCAIGHFFAAPPSAAAPLPPAAQAVAAATGWSLQTAVLSLPVRPPIAFHA